MSLCRRRVKEIPNNGFFNLALNEAVVGRWGSVQRDSDGTSLFRRAVCGLTNRQDIQGTRLGNRYVDGAPWLDIRL